MKRLILLMLCLPLTSACVQDSPRPSALASQQGTHQRLDPRVAASQTPIGEPVPDLPGDVGKAVGFSCDHTTNTCTCRKSKTKDCDLMNALVCRTKPGCIGQTCKCEGILRSSQATSSTAAAAPKTSGAASLRGAATDRAMGPNLPDFGTLATAQAIAGFKCSPNSGRCNCKGRADCDYMKKLLGGGCGTVTCTGKGASQQCKCTIHGF